MRRVERVRAATSALLGRTATSAVVERPAPVPAPAERPRSVGQVDPADVGKLSFRGYMAHMDRRQAEADPTLANKMRLRRSEELLAEERQGAVAPRAAISSPAQANKTTYNWASADLPQAGPAVLGGRFGDSSRHSADTTGHAPHESKAVAPMMITNPERGGYIYTQGELDALYDGGLPSPPDSSEKY
jgi:hypothetical protein